MWDEITYPFLNFNGTAVEVWGWMRYYSHKLLTLKRKINEIVCVLYEKWNGSQICIAFCFIVCNILFSPCWFKNWMNHSHNTAYCCRTKIYDTIMMTKSGRGHDINVTMQYFPNWSVIAFPYLYEMNPIKIRKKNFQRKIHQNNVIRL